MGKDNPQMRMHRFANVRKAWSRPSNNQIWELYEQGLKVTDIADKLGAEKEFVRRRIAKMINARLPPKEKPESMPKPDPRSVMECLLTFGHDEDFKPTPATEPTTEQPGSAAKVEVLKQRAAKGQELWHPQDVVVHRDRTGYGYRDGIQESCTYPTDGRFVRKGVGAK